MWQIWLILAGVFLIVEIMTVGFLIFWLSIGALLAMVVSFFTNNIIIQTSVFVVSSAIMILATKPFIQKFANNKNAIQTNVYSNIGKTGMVIQEIDSIHSSGQIKVGGEVWSAIGIDANPILKGTEVEIKEIKGVTAIVAPIKNNL